jgi:hypothetical protein
MHYQLREYDYDYQDGEMFLLNDNYRVDDIADGNITKAGINIGEYPSNWGGTIVFKAKVVNNSLSTGENTLENIATVTIWNIDVIIYQDTTTVMVNYKE